MRKASLVILALVAIFGTVQPAAAWSNGQSGPNSFGTHDWVLREGVRLSGRAGSWVCLRTALRATDDPDTRAGIDHASGTWWHVWDEWGARYGGAPEAVAVWFRRVEARRREGDRCGASRALGLMAHMLGDVAQPMHTDGRLAAEDGVHSGYEQAVDSRCHRSSCRYRAANDGFDRSRPYSRTVSVARRAHQYYGAVIRSYDRGGYTRRVDQITRRQLNRAANALADLIRSR